jgi:mono/diheme cytochrome c family protein
MTPSTRSLAVVLILATMIPLCAARPGGGAPAAPPDGAALYRAHCASCHGPAGRGDGAVAPYLRLPPADLTAIASRNRGVFPADRVRRIIDGRQAVRAHGDSDMPVWGPVFGRSPIVSDEAAIDATLRALVEHLASLQGRPAD